MTLFQKLEFIRTRNQWVPIAEIVHRPASFSSVLTDLHYLPGLAFFANLLPYETIWLEAHEHFQKQTYRNRCRIGTAQGIDTLVVPVLGGRSERKVPMRAVRIDAQTNWPTRHWRAIQTAYGKAPFFEDYADFFRPFFERQPVFLFDFSYALLTTCLNALGVKRTLHVTTDYAPAPGLGVFDARNRISSRTEAGPVHGYQPIEYRQNFGEQFFSNLSVIDLLFCQGPEALPLLRRSVVRESFTSSASSVSRVAAF